VCFAVVAYRQVTPIATGLNNPRGLAFGPGGVLYVGDAGLCAGNGGWRWHRCGLHAPCGALMPVSDSVPTCVAQGPDGFLYVGTLAFGANLATGKVQSKIYRINPSTEGAAFLSWRSYLLESWANDQQRRQEAGIPKEVRFRKKWELALEMIDQARSRWELAPRIVVADAGYGDVTSFREELETRKLRYVVGAQPNTEVWVEPPRARQLKPKPTGPPRVHDTMTSSANLGQGSGAAGAGLEKSSLAGRQQRMAGVSLLGGSRAGLPWIS